MEIEFKSNVENYDKEMSGLKPNTIREIDLSDERFLELLARRHLGKLGKITIRGGLDYSFERKITDITLWENWLIISWKHR